MRGLLLSVVAAVAVTQGRRAEGHDKRRQEAGSEAGSGARSQSSSPEAGKAPQGTVSAALGQKGR